MSQVKRKLVSFHRSSQRATLFVLGTEQHEADRRVDLGSNIVIDEEGKRRWPSKDLLCCKHNHALFASFICECALLEENTFLSS